MPMKVVIEEIWQRVYEVDTDDPETAADAVLMEGEIAEEKSLDFDRSHMIRVYADEDTECKKPIFEDVIIEDQFTEE